MYRLLKLSGASLRNCSPLSLRNIYENTDIKINERTCLLCKNLDTQSRIFARKSSSATNTFLSEIKRSKRKKKVTKKYSDILVVSDGASTLQKANIKILTSNDLKLLANTELNLGELYKLKDIQKSVRGEHTYNNLTAVDNLNSSKTIFNEPPVIVTYNVSTSTSIEPQESLEELNEAHSEVDLENIPIVNSLQPEVPEPVIEAEVEDCDIDLPATKESKLKPKIVVKPQDPRIQQHRDLITKRTLAAYIEICNHQKNPQRGLSAINFHRSRLRHRQSYYTALTSKNIYNSLLKGFAHKGDFDKLQEVLGIMAEDNVDKNEVSYAAIFECLGRINIDNNHLKDIRIFVKELHSKQLTFDDVMNKNKFLNDERDMVLKAIHSTSPSYTPNYWRPKVQYDNHLVNSLNDKAQLKYQLEPWTPNGGMFTPETLSDGLKKQMKMELDGYVQIKSIEPKPNPTEEVKYYRKSLENHYKLWEESALKAFQRDLAAVTAKKNPLNIEPYLRCIPMKDFISIIVEEAKKIAQGSESFSPTVTTLHTNLGYTVYVRYKILRKQQTGVLSKTLDIHNNYCTQYATNHAQLDYQPVEKNYVNSRQQWQVLEHDVCHTGPSLPLNHHSWVPTTLQAIGKFMYHIIMHDLKVNVNSMRSNKKNTNYLPAFYTIFRCQNRMVKEEVKPHPILSRLYRASESETLTFPTYELPMVCPPVPWVSTHFGGYLVSPCEVIRLPSCAFVQKQRLSETNPVKLYPSLDALNQLAAVPWKVNQNILDVILEVFQKGGSAKLDVPEHPSTLAPPKGFSDNMDKTEKYQVFKQKLQYKRKKDEMYSMWCDCLYRLSLANHFRNDTFWLPHNMDFRGRVYPIPPHLNHLGSDLARSILIFAEPRPLGPDGLDWLKIHLVNLTGLKKRDPVSERLKFANEIMDRILDSADNPLTGKRWWASSDEPWQTLACCMEIANVIRSGDTVNYRSHFPIHQDGSCNGLQHYAALGRDSAGAFSVNLAPSDVPQDVYSAVVQLVEQQRAKDAADGHEIAKVLEGFVVRKVIKQTIMTTVYGVTRYGARLQIARQLKDIDAFPKDSVWAASSYLTARTFDSLRTMFTSTKEIQDWFTECARLISSVSAKHVEWVTPLGLPIVQPYYKTKKVNTPAYGTFAVDQFGVPNVMKQKNAFPPNFIHSLDSSHMMLTSLHCEREGLTFVSVHDCYWTHPATVAIMNTICREQFVALHSEPILEDLSVYLMDKFRFNDGDISGDGSVMDLTKKKLNRRLQMLPRKGDFDVKNVLNSTYFFS